MIYLHYNAGCFNMQHPAFRIESSLVVSSESEYNITKTNTLIKDRKEIMKGMKPIKIYSCADRIQADMIVEALNENGIPAYTESQGSGGYMNIYMGTSVFGTDIYVDEADTARAKEIVAALSLPAEENDDARETQDISEQPVDKKLPVIRVIYLIAAVLMLIGAIAPSIIDIF